MSKDIIGDQTGGTAGEETGGETFAVDPAYAGYVFVGWAKGRFEADTPKGKEKRPYYNMYVITPVSGFASDDYQAGGMKAEKKKCLNEQAWEGLEVGNRVKLFFDDKGRVIASALEE